MRAIQVGQFGGPDVLELVDLPDPKAGPDEVIIRVKAAGVNPVDTYQRAGAHGYHPTLPFTPGIDGAGEVVTVGSSVTGLAAGDRVWIGGSVTGTYAELCVCKSDRVHRLRANLSFEQGACLYVNYATAYRALFQRGGATRGSVVLVHGATGGVGFASVQWAVHAGLDVIATYGSEIGRELLVAQGARRVVSHTEASHIAMLVEDGVSVDLVIEMLADVNLEDDLDLLRMGGRVVVVGSRGTIEITPRKLMSRAADIRGMSLANADETELREIYDAIDSGVRAGALAPAIQRTYPLARAAEAHHEVIENRSHGKIVLIP